MRPLTPFVSYFDNAGRMLVGRVRFCNLDGSPAEVFSDDAGETTLGDRVLTDSVGRLTVQPYLEDHDYILYFDRYVGSETMAEDDDPESWEEQGSAVNKYDTLGIEYSQFYLRSAESIDGLKHLAASVDGEVVLLMGYYVAGDKPPIWYKWNASSIETDNGGSCIQVEGTPMGRWVFTECPAQLDVRHFGAFPAISMARNAPQSYRIELAGNYVRRNGAGILFQSTSNAVYYDITGLILYNVDSVNEARLFCFGGGADAKLNGVKNVHCSSDASANGNIYIYDEVVYSSWEGDSASVFLKPSRKLVIDSELNYVGPGTPYFKDIEVEIRVYNEMRLVNCRITSNKAITGPISISDCEIETSWFADDYDFENNLTSSGNYILLKNCRNARLYVVLKNLQSEADYGDLGGQAINAIELLNGCVVRNAVFDNVTITGKSEFHDVSGSLSMNGGEYDYDIKWYNTRITFLTTVSFGDVEMYGCAVTSLVQGSNLLAVTTKARIEDSNVQMTIAANEHPVTLVRSIVGGQVLCSVLEAYQCIFNDHIYVYAKSSLKVRFVSNIVGASARMFISRAPTSSATSIRADGCLWEGNTIAGLSERLRGGAFWISIDKTYFDPSESNHDYEYRGNVGGMPENYSISNTNTVRLGGYGWTFRDFNTIGNVNLIAKQVSPQGVSSSDYGTDWSLYLIITDENTLTYGQFTYPNYFFPRIPNTFAISEAGKDAPCRIYVRVSYLANEFVMETRGTYNKATGLVKCHKSMTLTPVIDCHNDGADDQSLCDVLWSIWYWQSSSTSQPAYVVVRDEALNNAVISFVIEPLDVD